MLEVYIVCIPLSVSIATANMWNAVWGCSPSQQPEIFCRGLEKVIRNIPLTIPMMASIWRQVMGRGHIPAKSADTRGNSLYSASLFETLV